MPPAWGRKSAGIKIPPSSRAIGRVGGRADRRVSERACSRRRQRLGMSATFSPSALSSAGIPPPWPSSSRTPLPTASTRLCYRPPDLPFVSYFATLVWNDFCVSRCTRRVSTSFSNVLYNAFRNVFCNWPALFVFATPLRNVFFCITLLHCLL